MMPPPSDSPNGKHWSMLAQVEELRMRDEHKTPGDIARRLAGNSTQWPRGAANDARAAGTQGGFRRDTFNLPRAEARQKARDWFDSYPKAAYMTEIEFWQELPDDRIEFTIRRLPSAD